MRVLGDKRLKPGGVCFFVNFSTSPDAPDIPWSLETVFETPDPSI